MKVVQREAVIGWKLPYHRSCAKCIRELIRGKGYFDSIRIRITHVTRIERKQKILFS